MMGDRLAGRRVAFLATDGVQEWELAQPWDAVRAAGASAELLSLHAGQIQSMLHGVKGRTFRVDRVVSDVSERDYDALVLPGGSKSADALRKDATAVEFVRGFMEHDKPVGAICHGPELLLAADALRGRSITSNPKIETELEAGGCDWSDRPVVRDQNLVTSRTPDDLAAFSTAVVNTIATALDERSLDRTIEQSFPASDPPPGPMMI